MQLVLLEREARDRAWWSQMRDCYYPDAIVMVAWFQGTAAEFVDQNMRQAGPGRETVHRLSPPAVHLGHDRAVLSLPAVIGSRLIVDGVEADLSVHSRALTERSAGTGPGGSLVSTGSTNGTPWPPPSPARSYGSIPRSWLPCERATASVPTSSGRGA
jgi:hypothetical protein